MACTDTDFVFCGVFVLVNGLYCAISFLSSWSSVGTNVKACCVCMYVMADSWLVSFG